MIAYKFLKPDGSSVFTGFKWELPTGRPGPWVESAIEPCRSGIHACRPEHLPLWAGQTLYEVELDGEIVERQTKLIASRMTGRSPSPAPSTNRPHGLGRSCSRSAPSCRPSTSTA